MVTVSFPNWPDVLDSADLPEKTRKSHRVIIQWFLGHLSRESTGASVAAARDFVENLIATRKPADWQVEQWSEGLNWFFKEAPARKRVRSKNGAAQQVATSDETLSDTAGMASNDGEKEDSPDGRRQYAHTVAEMQDRVPLDPWYDETMRVLRVRHMAYRTEEAYWGWLRRMERFFNNNEGLENRQLAVGWSVLAHNLQWVARQGRQQQKPDSQASPRSA